MSKVAKWLNNFRRHSMEGIPCADSAKQRHPVERVPLPISVMFN